MNKIYEKGESKLKEDLSLEKLLLQIKKMKVKFKNEDTLNPEKDEKTYYEPELVIDLDTSDDNNL